MLVEYKSILQADDIGKHSDAPAQSISGLSRGPSSGFAAEKATRDEDLIDCGPVVERKDNNRHQESKTFFKLTCKRDHIVNEIVTSEDTYVSNLGLILEVRR